jgi:acyl carrier protein
MNTDIEDRLIECFQAALPTIGRQDIRTVHMKSTLEWDSMVTVTLISLIEESFGVETQAADIEQLTSFQTIRDYLIRASEMNAHR